VVLIYYPRNNPNSRVQQWNLQVEQQLGQNMAVDIAYVGTKMNNLATSYNVNQTPLNAASTSQKAYPAYGTINAYAKLEAATTTVYRLV